MFCPDIEKFPKDVDESGSQPGARLFQGQAILAPQADFNEQVRITLGVGTPLLVHQTAAGGGQANEALNSGGNQPVIIGRASLNNTTNSVGVLGISRTTQAGFGVVGRTGSQSRGAAGVKGIDGGVEEYEVCPNDDWPAGVRGESRDNYGVLGLSRWRGVSGRPRNAEGNVLVSGYLGARVGASNHGVYSDEDIGANRDISDGRDITAVG